MSQGENISISKSQKLENNKENKNSDLDLLGLKSLITDHHSNPFIAYLNVNFLHNKIDSLREVLKESPIHILCVDETKLDHTFPDSQFKIEGYQYPPFRRDRNCHGGGKIVFVKEGLIVKRLENYEVFDPEIICLEMTINKNKWFLMFCYRPPNSKNKKYFFENVNKVLNLATNNYENIFLAGDLNIDINAKTKDTNNHLSNFIDNFSLTNFDKLQNML